MIVLPMPRDFNKDWALRLAEAGLEIFPCGPDKKPLIQWRTFSSCDPDVVAQWWREFPSALPAIDLEKAELLVLDGDRHGGPDGRAALPLVLGWYAVRKRYEWHWVRDARNCSRLSAVKLRVSLRFSC